MAVALWIIGVVMIILGSLGNNLGNNLVSLDHHESNTETPKQSPVSDDDIENGQPKAKNDEILKSQNQATDSKDESKLTNEPQTQKSNWRLIGVITVVVGNLLTFASFGFAAQSLLASLESVQFVSNVFFVKYVHKEEISLRMVMATICIVLGNVLVVLFSDHQADITFTSTTLLHIYATNTAYQVYMPLAFVTWGIFHYIYTVYYNARVKERRLLWKHNFMEPFAFALSSAIVGTQAVLNSKCMSMLIQVSFRSKFHHNEFAKPTIWVVLIVWITFVSYWIRRLDVGLALFPPLFIIPVLQVFFVFFAIICGGLYFEEFNSFGLKQWIGFVVGVFLILGGVYGLAPVNGDLVKVAPDEASPELDEVKEGSSVVEDPLTRSEDKPVAAVPKKKPVVSSPPISPRPSSGPQVAQPTANPATPQHQSNTTSQPRSPISEHISFPNHEDFPFPATALQHASPHLLAPPTLDTPDRIAIKKKRLVVKRPSGPVIVQVPPAVPTVVQLSPVRSSRQVLLAPLAGQSSPTGSEVQVPTPDVAEPETTTPVSSPTRPTDPQANQQKTINVAAVKQTMPSDSPQQSSSVIARS